MTGVPVPHVFTLSDLRLRPNQWLSTYLCFIYMQFMSYAVFYSRLCINEKPETMYVQKSKRKQSHDPYWATAKATTEASEWDKETLIDFDPAAASASPDSLTLGPVSLVVISMSFMLAPAPLEGTESALNWGSASFSFGV
jgi:hypothetical protein